MDTVPTRPLSQLHTQITTHEQSRLITKYETACNPTARYADRDLRLVGHLHRAVRGGLSRGDRVVKYTDIKVDAPLDEAFRSVGHPAFATMISIGALVGLTTVMMVLMLGQSRVFFSMSRDHLLPATFAKVSPRFGTPVRTTMVTGVVVAVVSTFVPLSELAELVNIGTLVAFVLVATGVLVLRRARPDLKRAFRCPGVPVVPVLAVLTAVYLMLNLPAATWIRSLIWMVVGLVVYFVHSRRNSRFATEPDYDRKDDTAHSASVD